MRRLIRLSLTLLAAAIPALPAQDSVAGGVKVVSDKNPDCSSVDAIVASIIKPGMGDQQKAEAVFDYLVRRLYHLSCPQEPNGFALKNRKAWAESATVMDTVKNLNIYGHAICGSQSWYANELFNAAGLFGRIDGVDGHTVPEVKYDGAWHYLDVDMMGFVRRKDGTIPGVDDIKADKNLLFDKHDKQPEIFFKYDGPAGMWACLASGVQYAMYGRKIGIHSMNLSLREGERFNRYFRRQWGPKYRFYVPPWANDYLGTIKKLKAPAAGPVKAETHYLYTEEGAARFGNFELIYEAPLARKSCLDGVYASANVVHGGAAGLRIAKPEAPAEVVYKFYSPYGCAGVPGDLGKQDDDSEGAILEGEFASGSGSVSLSLDLGASWKEVHQAGGAFRLDLTPLLATRHCWLVKLGFTGANAGLKTFKSQISGQLSPASLPYTDGDTTMTFSRDGTDCVALFPDIGDSEAEAKRTAHAFENYESYMEAKGHVGFAKMKGAAIYRIEAPNDIVRVQAGAKFTKNRGAHNSVLFSLDEGQTWIEACKQRVVDEDEKHPEDFWGQSVEGILDFELKKAYSPGCIPGDSSVRENAFQPRPTRSVLVKFETSKGWLAQIHGIYAHYKRPGALPLTITHEWTGGKHEERIGAAESSKTYVVKGGKMADNLAIRIEAQAAR